MPARVKFRRRWKVLAALAAFGLVALNMVAYLHARAMTHFASAGERTRPPEELSRGEKMRVLLGGVSLPRPAITRTPAAIGTAYETLNFSGAKGILLEAWWLKRAESKGLIVLFHGYGGSKSELLPMAAVFGDLGYETVLVDFHGSGGSGGDTTSIGFHEAADVRSAWEKARTLAADKPVIFFGTSMGAAAILKAVNDGGVDPAAVILECPFDTLLNTVRHRFEAMRVPAFPAAQLLVLWGGAQHGFNGFSHNPAAHAAGVKCPALMLHGDQDARVSVAEAKAVHGNLKGRKEFVLFAGVGHECYANARPEEWKRAVKDFLAGVPEKKQ